MQLSLPVHRFDPSVPMPSYAHAGDAGLDLYARETVTIAPGERAQVATGIAVAIPEGYVGLVWDKSGLSQLHGLKTLGGVVDSGYRGEVMVGLVNLGKDPLTIERYRKVAQLLIQSIERVRAEEVDLLPNTDSARGVSGFGSTDLQE